MRLGGKGFSTRYDNDLGGNHIDRIRARSNGLGFFIDIKTKICSCCGNKKPTKGGTSPAKGPFACADCKAKRQGVAA